MRPDKHNRMIRRMAEDPKILQLPKMCRRIAFALVGEATVSIGDKTGTICALQQAHPSYEGEPHFVTAEEKALMNGLLWAVHLAMQYDRPTVIASLMIWCDAIERAATEDKTCNPSKNTTN